MLQIVITYVTNDSKCPILSCTVTYDTVPDDVRFNGQNHLIDRTDGGRKRCSRCGMNPQKCNKCGVALHNHCFELFHTR